jgi:hypothetical protein
LERLGVRRLQNACLGLDLISLKNELDSHPLRVLLLVTSRFDALEKLANDFLIHTAFVVISPAFIALRAFTWQSNKFIWIKRDMRSALAIKLYRADVVKANHKEIL